MEIVKRGYGPKNALGFGPKAAKKLNAAAQKVAFPMNWGYDVKSASTFIGNHHCFPSGSGLRWHGLSHITLEAALSGSLLLAGMDGTIWDLAGLRGSYRIVDKTVKAIDLLLTRFGELGQYLSHLRRIPSNGGADCRPQCIE